MNILIDFNENEEDIDYLFAKICDDFIKRYGIYPDLLYWGNDGDYIKIKVCNIDIYYLIEFGRFDLEELDFYINYLEFLLKKLNCGTDKPSYKSKINIFKKKNGK